MECFSINSNAEMARVSAVTHLGFYHQNGSWSNLSSNRFPGIPAGWSSAKSSLLNPRNSKRETANALPMVNVAVVLAVGAKSKVQASFSTEMSK